MSGQWSHCAVTLNMNSKTTDKPDDDEVASSNLASGRPHFVSVQKELAYLLFTNDDGLPRCVVARSRRMCLEW